MTWSALALMVLAFMSANTGLAQCSQPFQQRSLSTRIEKDIALRYYIHLPKGYSDRERPFPLLVYLHGGLGRGDDFQKLAWYPIPRMILEGSFPDSFVVLVPQCPAGQLWTEQTDALAALIGEITEHHRVDASRTFGIGYSMGGNGIVYLTFTHPKLFTAIAAMSGVYNTWWASRIKTVPTWFFHGAKDDHVTVSEADRMVEEYQREGAEPRYSRDPDGPHHPPSTKEHLDVLRWFLEQRADDD
jgi:predicted peptidase